MDKYSVHSHYQPLRRSAGGMYCLSIKYLLRVIPSGGQWSILRDCSSFKQSPIVGHLGWFLFWNHDKQPPLMSILVAKSVCASMVFSQDTFPKGSITGPIAKNFVKVPEGREGGRPLLHKEKAPVISSWLRSPAFS